MSATGQAMAAELPHNPIGIAIAMGNWQHLVVFFILKEGVC
jgi:hypothetical protein